jgi:hypothetical protein
VLDRFGDRDVLVATKEGLVVVLALAEASGAPDTSMGPATTGSLGKTVHDELSRLRRGSLWRIAVGRAHPGAYGISRSYEEAREGLTMAARMHLDSPIVEARDLLTYRVLARDLPALTDLVYDSRPGTRSTAHRNRCSHPRRHRSATPRPAPSRDPWSGSGCCQVRRSHPRPFDNNSLSFWYTALMRVRFEHSRETIRCP